MRKILLILATFLSLLSASSCTILKYQHDAIQAYAGKIKKERAGKADEARRRAILDEKLISEGQVRIGMMKSQVASVFGKPDIRQTLRIQGTYKSMTVWVYMDKKDCLIFINDRLADRQGLLDAAINQRKF